MVAFVDFVEEVKKEIAYFQAGGTSHRKLVVSLSAVVLHETDIRTVDYFRNKRAIIDLVQDLIPSCIW